MQGFLAKNLENIVNHYIKLDPYTAVLKQPLLDKTVSLKVLELPFTCYMRFTTERVFITPKADSVDVTIKGSLAGFAMLSLSHNKNKVFSEGSMEIIGDTELAQQFQLFWQNIHIDWEEHISHWTGDPIAHWLGRGGRLLKRATSYAQRSLTANLTEYLQEELRYLPPREEIADFMNDVDLLRMDLERLSARIERCKKRDPQNYE